MTQQLMSISHQPFSYQYLKDVFREYSYPRNKISKLLSSGELISLKSGLYALSESYGKELVPEVVANLLYGPSYVSLDYALSFYGMIPERVFCITSVTTGRKKLFDTSYGSFSYQQLKPAYYCLAYIHHRMNDTSYLIASAEKALCDKLYLASMLDNSNNLQQYLFDDLRIDERSLEQLDKKAISKLADASGKRNLKLLKRMIA